MFVLRSLLLSTLLLALTAQAHDARPNYVQITETEANTFSVSWKVPSSVPGRALPYPTLPDDCVADRQPAWQQAGAEYIGQQVFRCEEGLSGRVVGIEFPIINPSLSTLYKIKLGNGEEHLRILKPSVTEWTVPDAEDRYAVATQYTALGVEHIWIGIDHLLFVACLVFIAGTSRRLLITITGFTVAHSITLALSALDLIRIPTPPVEAAIALSVVFMAWEIAKGNKNSLTYRYPIAVGFVRFIARFRICGRTARYRPTANGAADCAAVFQCRCRDRTDPVRAPVTDRFRRVARRVSARVTSGRSGRAALVGADDAGDFRHRQRSELLDD
jgi:hypothetical protein